jgi:hypothetical protein
MGAALSILSAAHVPAASQETLAEMSNFAYRAFCCPVTFARCDFNRMGAAVL